MKKQLTYIVGCLLSCLWLQAQPCQYNWPLRMHSFQQADTVMQYADTGKGNPIVLVHGLGGSAAHWVQNIPGLVAAGHRVIAVHLPGYAGTPGLHRDAATQLPFYARQINALAQHLQLRNATLVGHSMGGQTAIWLALQQPAWLQRLVLAAPAGIETFTAAEANLLKQYATPDFFAGQDSATIVRNVRNSFAQMPPSAQALIDERLAMRHCPWFAAYCQTVAAGVNGMLAAPVANRLSELRLPVLLLFGQQDASIPNKLLHPALQLSELIQTARNSIPHLQAHTLTQAGHLLQWEQPAAFNEALLSFIRK